MAGQRDTRCISAAFDFLNTDFCHDCILGSDPDTIEEVAEEGRAVCKVKKSESDTALLDCEEENLRNSQKLRVCFCENGLHTMAEQDGDFLQEYLDRHTPGNKESGQVGREVGACIPGEPGKSFSPVEGSNPILEINGYAKKDMTDRLVALCETTPDNGLKLTSDHASVVTDDITSNAKTDVNDERFRENDSDSSSSTTKQSCVNGEICTTHFDGEFENSEVGQVMSSPSDEIIQQDEECNIEEVEMRPNRKSLHRRSTNTAMISSAFNFLPNTDSVFLPAAGGATESSLLTTHMQRFSTQVLPSVLENETGLSTSRKSVNESVQNVESSDLCDYESSVTTTSDGSPDVAGGQRSRSEEAGVADVRFRRSRLSKQNSMTEEEGSGDSSDEDAGVYAESFRRSNWIRIDDDGQLELSFPAVDTSRLSSASRSSAASRLSSMSTDTTDCSRTPSPKVVSDEPPLFPEKSPSPRLYMSHARSDSTSTTLSEKEFKKEYVSRRKCLIQRQNSSKEYHRYSAKVYDEEKSVTLEKESEESDFGLHILDSQPAYITKVDPGSAADRAGVEEGQILVSVNGTNVLSLSHDDIVAIISNSPSAVQIDLAISDFQPSRDLQASVIEGHMQKLGSNTSVIMRRWKKRYFVLRQDSCLYYYKHKDDSDPLGAIPLAGYTFSRHLDSGRDYCFKAEKYGARTYYFMTDNRDDMTEWVGALSAAAAMSKKRKESFVSVSSHNVGLPALEVRRPECAGYLLKVGYRHKTWHRRYCILKDACLYYYKNVNSLSALGVAHLHGYKVDPSISIGKKHAFALVPPDDSLRTFQFSAENETDRIRWVDAMIRSIQRWVQIDNDC